MASFFTFTTRSIALQWNVDTTLPRSMAAPQSGYQRVTTQSIVTSMPELKILQ